MLISEIKGWHWAISWYNPRPANSSSMLNALGALGRLTKITPKTTVVLAPKSDVDWRDIREAIVDNLNPKTGNAFYVNLRSGKVFQYGRNTRRKWKRAN